MNLSHKFIKNVPEILEDGVIYISMDFATAIHKCCCGCGNEVVTPFSPTDWQLAFDGQTISLYPSIGNWNFECQSHYWITNNQIDWAPKWNKRQIESNKKQDEIKKDNYYNGKKKSKPFFNFFRKKKD